MSTDAEREKALCYVALHDCGGWQGVTVISDNTSERKRAIAKDVARWVRAGLRLETWTVKKFREEAKMCQCLKNRKKSEKQQGKLI